MRISSNLFFQTGLHSINQQQSDLLHLYQQTASGQRMVTPADDPLAAAQSINLAQSQSQNARFAENRAVLKTNLGIEENALNSVTLLLQDVKTRLIEAGNGTMSDADRATLSNVLANAKQNLLGLANSQDGSGQYLFSGHRGNQPAFEQSSSGTVSYNGNGGQRLVQADATRQIAASDVGSDVFMSATAGSRVYITKADADNSGTGVSGSPVITNPSDPSVGRTFVIEFGDSLPLTYTVTMKGYTDQADPPVAHPDETTAVPIAFADGTTRIQVSPGMQVSFSGTPAPGDSFTVEPAAQTNKSDTTADLNIFGTLDDIIAALGTPLEDDADTARFQNSLATAIQKIDVNYDQVLTVRSSVGARLNEIDAMNNSGQQRGLGYAQRLSDLEDVDYYQVTAQLQLRTAALEAAALAFKQIQGTSLFNMGGN